jgi:hypothetical protein
MPHLAGLAHVALLPRHGPLQVLDLLRRPSACAMRHVTVMRAEGRVRATPAGRCVQRAAGVKARHRSPAGRCVQRGDGPWRSAHAGVTAGLGACAAQGRDQWAMLDNVTSSSRGVRGGERKAIRTLSRRKAIRTLSH